MTVPFQHNDHDRQRLTAPERPVPICGVGSGTAAGFGTTTVTMLPTVGSADALFIG
jgi:hypothetical protein